MNWNAYLVHWPFVLRSTYDRARLENYTLRDALKCANEELRKHRLLIGSLRDGQVAATRMVENVLKEARTPMKTIILAAALVLLATPGLSASARDPGAYVYDMQTICERDATMHGYCLGYIDAYIEMARRNRGGCFPSYDDRLIENKVISALMRVRGEAAFERTVYSLVKRVLQTSYPCRTIKASSAQLGI